MRYSNAEMFIFSTSPTIVCLNHRFGLIGNDAAIAN